MGPGLKLGVDALVLDVDAVAQILADDRRSGTAKARVFTEVKRGLGCGAGVDAYMQVELHAR